MIPYVPPAHKKTGFNCPHCGAFANQRWSEAFYRFEVGTLNIISGLNYAACSHCQKFTLWLNEKLIIPSTGGAPMPNNDLPEEIKADYEEARAILNRSPRGAAALLRLCIQKLCKHLGEEGKNINTDIGNLVKKGLPPRIQQSLDIVRVIGNNAVHPGQINLNDDMETAAKLFLLVNIVADVMITQPNEIDKLFNSLPPNQLEGIAARDKQK
ncbi:DUF4145 domain-containing protein [Pontibacter flavimaris]|uniref:DUF4145 domain-containing protein n=1 Tax=Pontibacter flavimaris TaxID=1797110 RepID=A0A1Q5PBC2_9BACT|nr:DUF4145 domain-containing protein [Pontibacter flavimaris]OKL39528.1 hypothetical protein A3841_00835 [Pontibacter flavimaris]